MAKDPYRYFRIEAQELLEALAQGLLALEKRPDAEVLRALLRHAHTFKGASRVVRRPDIGDLAHALEDVLTRHPDGSLPAEDIDAALRHLDQIRSLVASLDGAPEDVPEAGPAPPPSAPGQPTVRVEMRELDALLASTLEAEAAAWSLRRTAERLEETQRDLQALAAAWSEGRGPGGVPAFDVLLEAMERSRRRLDDGLHRLAGDLGAVRWAASEIRLVPAESLLADLERIARDAARELDKAVEFRGTGGDTRVDANVLAELRKALVHLVRNAVAHGIEARAERARAGKDPVGRIEVAITRRGHRVSISCRDDGAGLDFGAVRAEAVRRGLVDAAGAASMTEPALRDLLLRGGVSTAEAVTGVSGRGVGLETVRLVVEGLKGELELGGAPGRGLTAEIAVPVSLLAMPALATVAGDTEVLLPLDSIHSALHVEPTDIARDETGTRMIFEGKVIPFYPLRRALRDRDEDGTDSRSAVIVRAEGQLAAIGVDRIGAVQSIVLRSLPAHAQALAVVAGASLDRDGRPQLVLSPSSLVREAVHAVPRPIEPRRPALPLLVVDDSLTTRMLEQSILESAGYDVELAVSGEEGLRKAHERSYGLFIVDVEMPGMSGFEFVERVQADPRLRAVPAILVTSRAAPEDKRRGHEAGARAYIVKSEFDQTAFLKTIEELLA